jgi:ubiquinone biosynthesis protein
MNEQIGLSGGYERLKIEAPQWSKTLPQLPRLIHHALASRHDAQHGQPHNDVMRMILLEQKRTNRLLQGLLMFGIAAGIGAVVARVWLAMLYGG